MPPSAIISSAIQKQPKHILVVEDNLALRFMLAEWLRSLNYVVHEVSSADEALIILASLINVDFVITDVRMPGTMDGLGLAFHIRKTYPGLEVIVVSGNDAPEVEIKGITYIKKPYDLETISSHIAKALSVTGKEEVICNE